MSLPDLQPGDLQPGDLVYAAVDLYNDGGIPELPVAGLIAAAGTRGVVVRIGQTTEEPERAILLVRFEGEGLTLGPPTGCWPEEITTAPPG